MTRFSLPSRRTSVVPLATFESCNDPGLRAPRGLDQVQLDLPPQDAARPPFDWDTARAPVAPPVAGWPAVGMTEGRTIEVRLRRLDLDPAAPLELRSSDPALLVPGPVAAGKVVSLVTLTAPPGAPRQAAPRLVRLEAVSGGHVVAVLAVHVHTPLAVKLRVHRLVPVQQTKTGARRGLEGAFPAIGPALARTNAIWAQAGVEFLLDGDAPMEVPVDYPPLGLEDWDERAAFERGAKGVANVFLLDRSLSKEREAIGRAGHTVGIGILEKPGFGQPFVLLYSRAPPPRDQHRYWASDPANFSSVLGHELGHLLELDHPVFRDQQALLGSVEVQRLLMCPTSPAGVLLPSGYRLWQRGANDEDPAYFKGHGTTVAREAILRWGYAT